MMQPERYVIYRAVADQDGNGSVSSAESSKILMDMEGLTDKQRGEPGTPSTM